MILIHFIILIIYVQIDLILWGLLCFLLVSLARFLLYKKSYRFFLRSLTKKQLIFGMILCECLSLPVTYLLSELYGIHMQDPLYIWLFLIICILSHGIRMYTILHHYESIKNEL